MCVCIIDAKHKLALQSIPVAPVARTRPGVFCAHARNFLPGFFDSSYVASVASQATIPEVEWIERERKRKRAVRRVLPHTA